VTRKLAARDASRAALLMHDLYERGRSKASLTLRSEAGMEFEAGLVVSLVLVITAFVVDWPRALAGLAFGAVSRYLPYGTVVVPLGVVALAAAGEFIYPAIGRTTEPTLGSFAVGLFSVAATASNLYITIRNFKDRL
jgi:hypothetical protein